MILLFHKVPYMLQHTFFDFFDAPRSRSGRCSPKRGVIFFGAMISREFSDCLYPLTRAPRSVLTLDVWHLGAPEGAGVTGRKGSVSNTAELAQGFARKGKCLLKFTKEYPRHTSKYCLNHRASTLHQYQKLAFRMKRVYAGDVPAPEGASHYEEMWTITNTP